MCKWLYKLPAIGYPAFDTQACRSAFNTCSLPPPPAGGASFKTRSLSNRPAQRGPLALPLRNQFTCAARFAYRD